VKGTAAVANETPQPPDIVYDDDGSVTITAPIATAEQTPTNEEN
jgi:hypothetical protein